MSSAKVIKEEITKLKARLRMLEGVYEKMKAEENKKVGETKWGGLNVKTYKTFIRVTNDKGQWIKIYDKKTNHEHHYETSEGYKGADCMRRSPETLAKDYFSFWKKHDAAQNP
jgi:hypothetical protein